MAYPNVTKRKQKTLGYGILDGVIPRTPGQNAEARSISRLERDALMAAAVEISKHSKKGIVVEDDPQPCVGSEGHAKARKKGSYGKTSRSFPISVNKDNKSNNKSAINNKFEIFASESGVQRNETDSVVGDGLHESAPKVASSDIGVLRKHAQEVDATPFENVKQLPPVRFYALESDHADQNILDILKPSTIIVYHPDMAFVREIEIYKALNPMKKLKIYSLL